MNGGIAMRLCAAVAFAIFACAAGAALAADAPQACGAGVVGPQEPA